MGTPEIAATCLRRVYEDGHDIAAVYTKIDTPKNRGMKLTASPVKEFAVAHDLPVIQPVSFRDAAVVEELRALQPELICVVAYGKILPQSVLDIPKYGCKPAAQAAGSRPHPVEYFERRPGDRRYGHVSLCRNGRRRHDRQNRGAHRRGRHYGNPD